MSQTQKAIYRMVLPEGAGRSQRKIFEQNVAAFRQGNTGWSIYPDWPQTGEKQAFIVVPSGEQEVATYASYKIAASLGKAFLAPSYRGGYGDRARY